MTGYIPDDEWATVVRNVPIVSVDLVVRYAGGVVLGKRTNDPAKGEWFLPGGRVHKYETRRDAVHRVAREELGVDVTVERELGVTDHVYDTADVPGVDGKHYLSTGYLVTPESDPTVADDQHGDLRVFEPPFPDLHEYVETYLDEVEW